MLASLKRFQQSKVAQQRLKILQFYAEYGEQTTKQAFNVDRKTLWVWQRQLDRAQGQLDALIPKSTRPQRSRTMQTDPRVVMFIRQLRGAHPHLGKDKIKPLLDSFCRQNDLATLSVSTIGKVIRRDPNYRRPAGRRAKTSRKTKGPRDRIRYAPQPQEPGHLALDTIERQYDGIKLFFYSVLDLQSRFAFSLPYPHCNSRNSADFLKRFQAVYPLAIHSVQTDNGSEFLGEFVKVLAQYHIPHRFTYPRCPKINGRIERFQRSLQEEFVDAYEDLFGDGSALCTQLAAYLVFYNAQRPHQALNFQTPIQFMVNQQQMSKMSATSTY